MDKNGKSDTECSHISKFLGFDSIFDHDYHIWTRRDSSEESDGRKNNECRHNKKDYIYRLKAIKKYKEVLYKSILDECVVHIVLIIIYVLDSQTPPPSFQPPVVMTDRILVMLYQYHSDQGYLVVAQNLLT
jgi:hypothetical protein